MKANPGKAPRKGPMLDLCYWALHYRQESFYIPGTSFKDYGPALYLGVTVFNECPERSFDELREGLELRYLLLRGDSRLDWRQAMPVARAAWMRARAVAICEQLHQPDALYLVAAHA